MAASLDAALRKQLVEARENIESQLIQLEGMTRGRGDCRALYAQLQRELHDIDTLLGADGVERRGLKEGDSAYEPMVRLNADGSVGNMTGPTSRAKIWAIVGIALILVWIGVTLFKR